MTSLSTALKELDKMSYDVDDEDLKNEPIIAFSDARSLLTTFAESLLREARTETEVKKETNRTLLRDMPGYNIALEAVRQKWEKYLSKKGG